MASPGVSTIPILLVSGSSPFCETFFDDVRVPRDQVVGKVNRGRDVAKYLLGHEHKMISVMGLAADDPVGWSRPWWARFGEIGLAGMPVPEAAGGSGLGHVEAGIVLEAVGRNLSPSPFLSTAVAGVTPLRDAGAAVRDRWHPGIVAGEPTIGIAVDEGAGHRPAATALRAERSGNGFRLTGSKQFVVQGASADLLLVVARTAGTVGDTDGLTLFAVPRDVAGLSMEDARLADSGMAARLMFGGVAVDADAVIGEVDGGWELLSRMLDADHADASKWVAVAKAKAKAGRAATLAVQEGVQMHGGIGMTDAYDIGLYMKRDRVLQEWFGDAGFEAERLAVMNGHQSVSGGADGQSPFGSSLAGVLRRDPAGTAQDGLVSDRLMRAPAIGRFSSACQA